MFGTTQDITRRKRAEQALRRSQFYLSEGQRIAHIGSWAFNEAGHYWSDELFNIYGLESENGAPTVEQYLDLIHPQDRAAMAETIRKMQEEHCGHDLIERIIRPDGQLRYIRAVAVPVIEEGVFKGFIGSTMDVTEQELLTRELARASIPRGSAKPGPHRQLGSEFRHHGKLSSVGRNVSHTRLRSTPRSSWTRTLLGHSPSGGRAVGEGNS